MACSCSYPPRSRPPKTGAYLRRQRLHGRRHRLRRRSRPDVADRGRTASRWSRTARHPASSFAFPAASAQSCRFQWRSRHSRARPVGRAPFAGRSDRSRLGEAAQVSGRPRKRQRTLELQPRRRRRPNARPVRPGWQQLRGTARRGGTRCWRKAEQFPGLTNVDADYKETKAAA
jgi:hypothetical protein